ncbi:MAG TPA: nucleotidyl transferase AbiEii/AbiGii toxin family protein [Croceibacterium sp.]|nr:nucleotidyl transferase AbiEii/AbiGii toxin family protein [Croceibacterium sp.]
MRRSSRLARRRFPNARDALRPHSQVEVSARPPRLPPRDRALTSFIAQYRKLASQVPSIPCADPVEAAADKVSAFAWRALVRVRGDGNDDPTIVRHVHDLAVLETIAS